MLAGVKPETCILLPQNVAMSVGQFMKSRAVLVLWLVLGGTLMTYFICTSCRDSWVWYAKVSAFTSSIWISMWLGNEYLSHALDARISWTKKPVQRFAWGVVSMLVYTVGATFILTLLFTTLLGMRGATFSEMVYGTVGVTFLITLFMTSRAFLFEWRRTAVESEKFQRESMAARYESLKSQVNPHFLFNSLNVLTNLVYEDPDKAARFIKQLSEVYRYVLDTRDREVVPLQEELKFLESYVYLQQIRFAHNLRIEIDGGLKSRPVSVVPLALQMLIENAIKHNVVSGESPLQIKVFLNGDFIVVENQLQVRKRLPEESPGLGLENIQNRYAFLTDRKVEVIRGEKQFTVKLPVLELKQ